MPKNIYELIVSSIPLIMAVAAYNVGQSFDLGWQAVHLSNWIVFAILFYTRANNRFKGE